MSNLITRGLVEGHGVGAGLLNRGEQIEYQMEVRELERAGTLSKIQILEVSGVDKNLAKQVKENFAKWIPTAQITELEL